MQVWLVHYSQMHEVIHFQVEMLANYKRSDYVLGQWWKFC